jgi:hypothetical protein
VTTAFVPAPRFVGFAHGAPRELRDVDELYDLRAGRPVRLADVYTGTALPGELPSRGLPHRSLPPGRTALLARELTGRAAMLALD